MAYNKFTMAQLRKEYYLTITDQSGLFADTPPATLSDWLRVTLAKQTDTALRSGSEKARSEYLIAPILLEVYEQSRERANLFSGVEFDVDKKRGLAGFCDFLFTLAPRTIEILAPVVSVVEAKKEDIPKGIPQCLAELVAAQMFNAAEERPIDTLYGIVTTEMCGSFFVCAARTPPLTATCTILITWKRSSASFLPCCADYPDSAT